MEGSCKGEIRIKKIKRKKMNYHIFINKKENTTFKFYNNQLSKVNRFFDYVEILQNKNKVYHESNINELEELKIKNGKYLDLLDQITNKNDKSYISDINTVKSLLNECKINSNIKREIFYNLMRYNALCNSQTANKMYV